MLVKLIGVMILLVSVLKRFAQLVASPCAEAAAIPDPVFTEDSSYLKNTS